MIDWNATEKEFGYKSSNELKQKRSKVICKCDKCNKIKTITIRIKSKIVNEQMPWLCPSCVGKSRSPKISEQLKKQWDDKDYRNKRSKSSLKLWESSEYTDLHSKKVKEAMDSVNMSEILLKRYEDPNARIIITEASNKAWENPELKKKHLAIMRNPAVREAISKKVRKKWLESEYRNKMAAARACQIGKISSIQKMLYDLLDDIGVEYFPEGERTKFGYYVFDCYIESHKLLIECQGDYWHSLQRSQMRDKQKFTYISKYFPGHKLVYFWEREFYENNKVLSRLKSLLGINSEAIDFSFSDVSVSKIDRSKNFLDLYHYIGPGRGGIKIGAFLSDELIAVAVFSHPVRQNLKFDTSNLELSRFCIHPNYHKKNFASWFISKCVKLLPKTVLFSYADSTVGHSGTIYKAAGWSFDHEVKPDYWYISDDGFVMHKKTLYNRAINLKLKESEFASKFRYQKIVGGPKYCYVLDNK